MRHPMRTMMLAVWIAVLVAGIAVAAETAQKGTLEQYFQKAKQDYVEKDMKAASEEIHKAAEWMKSEAAKAKGKGKKALTASYRELEKLGEDLKKEAVKSEKEIEMASARAYQALATNSHVKSAEAWSKKEYRKAADELDAAADALGKAYIWARQEVKAGTQKVISESKELARKLKEGARQTSAEADRTLKEMEQEISTFGKKISSRQ